MYKKTDANLLISYYRPTFRMSQHTNKATTGA